MNLFERFGYIDKENPHQIRTNTKNVIKKIDQITQFEKEKTQFEFQYYIRFVSFHIYFYFMSSFFDCVHSNFNMPGKHT